MDLGILNRKQQTLCKTLVTQMLQMLQFCFIKQQYAKANAVCLQHEICCLEPNSVAYVSNNGVGKNKCLCPIHCLGINYVAFSEIQRNGLKTMPLPRSRLRDKLCCL